MMGEKKNHLYEVGDRAGKNTLLFYLLTPPPFFFVCLSLSVWLGRSLASIGVCIRRVCVTPPLPQESLK